MSQVRAKKDGWQGRADNSKLIYVGAGTKAGITGTTISNMFLTESGGECVRFRNQTTNGLVVNSVIQWCGMLGLGVEPDQYKYHNAEGVYIGTSPKSTTQPFYTNDTSNNIVVKDSTINTFGSECFKVKENAHHNRMENVDCGYNDEPLANQGSNVELRGDHNTVLGSRLYEEPQLEHEARVGTAAKYDHGGNTAQGNDVQRRRDLPRSSTGRRAPGPSAATPSRRRDRRPQRQQRQQPLHLRRGDHADGDGPDAGGQRHRRSRSATTSRRPSPRPSPVSAARSFTLKAGRHAAPTSARR